MTSETSNFRRGLRRVALALTICYFVGSIAYIYFNVKYFQLLKIISALALMLAGPFLIWSAYFLYVWLAAGFRARRPDDMASDGRRSPQLQEGDPGDPVKRFRVAFSFAGEKQNYVARMAAVLASRFGREKILYDEYHRSEFSRGDLGFYLPDLYHESDLVVVVVCPDYDLKEWCGLEWNAIFDLLKKRKHEEVMLCRFGRASVRGLYSIAGFLELDDLTADQAATNILERLALNEDKPRSYYLSGTEATGATQDSRA